MPNQRDPCQKQYQTQTNYLRRHDSISHERMHCLLSPVMLAFRLKLATQFLTIFTHIFRNQTVFLHRINVAPIQTAYVMQR